MAPAGEEVLVHCRAARAEDLTALGGLAEAFYVEDNFAADAEALNANLHVLLGSATAHVAVVDDAGELVAFAVTTTSFGLENGRIAELEDLYVIPRARRRGLAELLIDDSARWARERGCGQLELVVAPNGLDITHLHRYYLARGFHDEGRRLLSRPLQRQGQDDR